MSEMSVMSNTCSAENELQEPKAYIPAGTDLLYDLRNTPRDFDYDKMRAGYRADGCPEELIEKFIKVLQYRRPTNE
jgi:hypothetical protein